MDIFMRLLFLIGGSLLCISLFLSSYGLFKLINSKSWKQGIFNYTFLYISLLTTMCMLIPFINIVTSTDTNNLFIDWEYHLDSVRAIEVYESSQYPNLIYLFYPISKVNAYFFHTIITIPFLLFVLTKNRWSIYVYFLSTIPFAFIMGGWFKQLTFIIFFLLFLIIWRHKKIYSIPLIFALIYFSGLPMRFTMPSFNMDFNYLVTTPFNIFIFMFAMVKYHLSKEKKINIKFWTIWVTPIILMVFNIQPYLRVSLLLWIYLIVLVFKDNCNTIPY